MTLSQFQEAIWHRRACNNRMPQFNQHAPEVKTVIKPEAIFRQMSRDMLRSKRMTTAPQWR